MYIDNDDVVMVRTPDGKFNNAVISIPPSLFPGLMNALHIKLDHPSRAQLTSLVQRYFYTPGWRAYIDEISNQCHQCASLKTLPKVLLEDTTSIPQGVATNLSADVIERANQKILIVRDNLSQYIKGIIIPDQTADALREALLSLVLDILPDSGTSIRVDGATAFQALCREAITKGSLLNQFKITIDVGRLINKNKNPIAENGVKEVLKEILRYKGAKGPISPTDLAVILRTLNSRIRLNGLSAHEIMFKRDMISNNQIDTNEEKIKTDQQKNRTKASLSSQKAKLKLKKSTPQQSFTIGQLVFLRDGRNKISPRDTYIIEDIEESKNSLFYLIRKVQSSLRSRLYKALPDELIAAPTTSLQDPSTSTPFIQTNLGRSKRSAAIEAQKRIAATANKISQPKKYKYGWLSEDQISDDDNLPFIPYSQDGTDSAISSTSISDSSTPPPATDTDTSTDSDAPALSWDTSPEQYQLYNSNHVPQPVEQPSKPPILPRYRQRLQAVSSQSITRSNAFRDQIHPPAPRKPRVPTPISPSQVHTTQVNNVSEALDCIQTQVYTNTNRPQRSIPRPNYRLLNSRGRDAAKSDGQRNQRDVQPEVRANLNNYEAQRGRQREETQNIERYRDTQTDRRAREDTMDGQQGTQEGGRHEEGPRKQRTSAILAAGYQPATSKRASGKP